MKPPLCIRIAVLAIFTLFSLNPALIAQDAGYLEDEGSSLWEEQQFLDVTGEEFMTEDAQYVGEEDVEAAKEAARKAGLPSIDLASALDREKQMLPDNIMYGIGTGAMLGGWFALTQGKEARQNVQYLTVGTLIGALIGVAVGYKSLFMTPTAALTPDPTNNQIGYGIAENTVGESLQKNVILTPQFARFDLQFKF